jgi:hypothetical protein
MNSHEENRMKQLLKQALPPVNDAEPASGDLWPAVRKRLEAWPAAPPWIDWALAGGLAVFGVFFPAAIPVFLYYL